MKNEQFKVLKIEKDFLVLGHPENTLLDYVISPY